MLVKIELNKTYQFLLVALAFLMPITVAGANTIVVIICLLWLLSGNYKSKLNQILSSKIMIASIVFYFIHIIGMLWTDDIAWGLHILHKMWYFILFFPILFNIVSSRYIKYYISSFLIAITMTEVLSYLVWFEIIDPFKNATVANPTPFMSHISYNPILAFSIYLVAHRLLNNKDLSIVNIYFYSFFLITMTVNMFITGGRAGQVMFFAFLTILIFQYFRKKILKAIILLIFLFPTILITAFNFSPIFHDRANGAIDSLININSWIDYQSEVREGDKRLNYNSVGERIVLSMNSLKVFKQSPIIGVGTGDFPNEYMRVNEKFTPNLKTAVNPHNMYALISVQLGLVGLISMLSIFYYQIIASFKEKNILYKDLGLALPLSFLLIMLSDSYILGHFTTLLFVFFSSFLYQKFD
jgi:O-antigen ligase